MGHYQTISPAAIDAGFTAALTSSTSVQLPSAWPWPIVWNADLIEPHTVTQHNTIQDKRGWIIGTEAINIILTTKNRAHSHFLVSHTHIHRTEKQRTRSENWARAFVLSQCTGERPEVCVYLFSTFTFSHLADTFVQSMCRIKDCIRGILHVSH